MNIPIKKETAYVFEDKFGRHQIMFKIEELFRMLSGKEIKLRICKEEDELT